MTTTKTFIAATLLFAIVLSQATTGYGKTKEIIAEGEYVMGEGETMHVSKQRAIDNAKRTALEEAGTYVRSFTKLNNMNIMEDEVEVLSAGLMSITVLDRKKTFVADSDAIRFYVKIKAVIETDNLKKVYDNIKKDSKIVKAYEREKKARLALEKEIAALKEDLKTAKASPEKNAAVEETIKKIAETERRLEARQWLEKGQLAFTRGKWDETKKHYTKAISVDPTFAEAYTARSLIQTVDFNVTEYILAGKSLKDAPELQRALEDANKAISLEPKSKSAYMQRGLVYSFMQDYKSAIEDAEMMISVFPDAGDGYLARAGAYLMMGNQDDALKDYNKAIPLFDPKSMEAFGAYMARSMVHGMRSDYGKALEDANSAIKANPNFWGGYSQRGSVYIAMKDYDKSLESYNKAISMDPKNGPAYYSRSNLYTLMGKKGLAKQDIRKACELGFEIVCAML